VTVIELKGDVVILACAVSAGIHAALVPAHLAEGTGGGVGFAGAAAVLAGLVLWLTRRPASLPAVATAAATFAGLLAGYALAITTGLPLLHPDAEPVDGLALATKAIEAAGLLAAASLLWRPRVAPTLPQPKGSLT
jgi:CHASE2 domain-containing sensor protein